MFTFFDTAETAAIFIFILFSIIILQVLVLLRIKMTLQNISTYIENISKFFFRMGITTSFTPAQQSAPKTCQYCKYRLSYIHMSKNEGEIEDFYYRCQIRNIEITLDDSCEQFENEKTS